MPTMQMASGKQLHRNDGFRALTPAFPYNWRRLPDELKVRVLANLVTFALKIGVSDMPNGDGSRRSVFCRQVLPVLACPELAGIASEVFYKTNTFRICMEECPLKLPNPRFLLSVRHLKISLATISTDWNSFARLAHGSVTSLNLHQLQIVVDGFHNSKELQHEEFKEAMLKTGPIALRPRELQVVYFHHRSLREDSTGDWTLDELDSTGPLVFEHILAAANNGTNVRTTWERYTHRYRGSKEPTERDWSTAGPSGDKYSEETIRTIVI